MKIELHEDVDGSVVLWLMIIAMMLDSRKTAAFCFALLLAMLWVKIRKEERNKNGNQNQ